MSSTLATLPNSFDRLRDAAVRFCSAPASATPLAAFRIGLASVLLAQGLSLAADVAALYGPQAVAGWDVLDPADERSVIHPFAPRLRIVVAVLARVGLTAEATTRLVFLTYLTAVSCLLVGWKSRTSAAVAWLTHFTLSNAAAATIYGVDMFAHIGLFYCTVFPVGRALSLDATRLAPAVPCAMNRVALRVLQLHLCVVYLSSAIEKATGPQWWNGEAIWRAVTLPEMAQVDLTWLASAPWLAVLIGWGTLALEAGYAMLVWPRRTRVLTALATISMHLGIGAVMGLFSFSALMIVLSGAAFLVPAEPRARFRGA